MKLLFESEKINISTEDDNNDIVIINSIRFKGKRSVDWKDVEGYLSKYRNIVVYILEKGHEIRIDGSFANEFCWSKDTKKLMGALAKAKASASQAIVELLRMLQMKDFKTIWRKSIIQMQNMGGIDIPVDFAYPL